MRLVRRVASPLGVASVILLAVVFPMPFAAGASCNKDPECDDATAWYDFTRVVLRQTAPGSAEGIEWVASFDHDAADASIDVATHGSSKPMSGTVALIGGRVMLSKGLLLEAGYEIDALDAPVLSIKLLMSVLGRIFPNGPDDLVGSRNVDHTDSVGIKFATSSASGYIPAPWHVAGQISKLVDGKVVFDIVLSVPPERDDAPKSSSTMKLSGELAVLGRPVFLDTDSLAGWTTYGLGPQQIKQGASTILDYGASADDAMRYRTVGDVRAFIATEDHPGTRDATKDFTGFWKQECDEPYGLQIRHHGEDGKYSIVFCGPGGCGEPSQSRLTFITGDKGFQVVSETELIQLGRSGDGQTYYRCTKETHPVLKYQK